MRGMNRNTGKALSGLDHARQSIVDILTTPIGTRCMRRDYGSRLFELIDAPTNASTQLKIAASTAEALQKWEPRVKTESVKSSANADGKLVIDFRGTYLPDGKAITLDGIVIA